MNISSKKAFYITTTLPYVNAKPHIGFAKEIIQADVLARFWRGRGIKVFFNTGADEHGLKIQKKAEEAGLTAQEYCDRMLPEFNRLKESLNLSYDSFIRTTDPVHEKAVQAFWRRCLAKGDIYKKKYRVKYCVGCELEKTDSELVEGKCPDHPNLEIELIEEENYFFRFSAYQEKLLELYQKNPAFVSPVKRKREIAKFVQQGLEDFSISRLKSKMAWGVPVPDDPDQVVYVWFDALVNYISSLGWPENQEKFELFWPGVQICGKDNLRQQAAMWQAMLMSAGLPSSQKVFVNGFITVNGQKMSKSLGNVISPYELVEKFGSDATRYLLLSAGGFGEDFDITWEKLSEKYNADLANGLGNLVSRVVKLYEKSNLTEKNIKKGDFEANWSVVENFFEELRLEQGLLHIWSIIQKDNQYIDTHKPWELVKTDSVRFEQVMTKLLADLNLIAEWLEPFLPETAEKIKRALENRKVAEGLFPRLK